MSAFSSLAGGIIAFLSSLAQAQSLSFTEQSTAAGLVHTHSGLPLLGIQAYASGGAVGDFNGDGYPDIFAVGGSHGVDRLFINQGNGTFVESAAAWGITGAHAGSGATVGDYDGDGNLDIFVSSLGTTTLLTGNQNRLWRNNGDGTFTNVAQAAGVRDSRRAGSSVGDVFSASFGDYDRDGDLDLAVAGWLGNNQLFRNNNNGTFTRVTTTAILTDMSVVRGFTPKFIDINRDRRPDLLWVADFFTSRLLIQNADDTFSDITASAGVGLDSNGMGSAVGDFNADGFIDWYVTSRISYDVGDELGNMLYLNQGNTTFIEQSVAAGVNDGGWGWGAAGADFDHDGHLDIIATNGWDDPDYENDPTRLFISNADGTFTDRASQTGLIHTGQGRGLATLDADRDGDLDVVIFSNNQALTYFENQLSGPNTNWLWLKFDTSTRADFAPDGFGVVVDITAGGLSQHRIMDGGSNYLCNSELGVHVGLGGNAAASQITVTWPNGQTTVLSNVPANQFLSVVAPPPPCVADFNHDGQLNFFDAAGFLSAFSNQLPQADLAPPTGEFNFFDVAAFLAAFSAGCP
ncbi:MAG: VCBS repeat-containing protein [Phycisphaerales bacterium]|nr:VCBS repeat-containing protein [Phycisphaerales bacterium]